VQAYTSANTEVLADLLEQVTGQRLPDLISRLIWSKIGAENDALFVVNGKGYPVAHAGMVTTLRDLARFGLWFTPSGARDPGGRVPAAFLQKLLAPRTPALQSGHHPAWFSHSSYQWDVVTKNGQIAKGGFADQMLFVDTRRDVVIAYFGTNKNNQEFPTPLPLVGLVEKYF
jgi:CubicO group peptidase (beta-lactamase class C family)